MPAMPLLRPVAFARPLVAVVVVVIAMTATLASGQPVERKPPEVGDDAPPLTVGRWLQGETIENFDRGRVYVVDFFAAGCGACRATIPHLNALAERHPEATFVGVVVPVESRRNRPPASIEPMAKLAKYRVAVDRQPDGEGGMLEAWLGDTPFLRSRPVTCIVDADGRLAWVGNPTRADEPLARILAGTYDLAAARRDAQAKTAREERRVKAADEFSKALTGRNLPPQDAAARLALAEEVYGKFPETADIAAALRFRRQMLAQQYDDAYLAADAWAAAANDDAQQLNELAWYIVDEAGVARRDLARARRYAERAVELTDATNAAILDTLAKAIFLQGDVARAIELQTRAMELCDEDDVDQLRVTLDGYRAAAATRPAAR